jgi:Ribonuclease G/E
MPVGRESTEAIKKMAAKERQERLAKEREEIAARVAAFRATQEKFQREREEFFRRTWRNIRQAEPQPFWS